MGLYWVPGHAGVQRRGNEIINNLSTDVSVQKFAGSEPSFWGSLAEHKKEDKTLSG